MRCLDKSNESGVNAIVANKIYILFFSGILKRINSYISTDDGVLYFKGIILMQENADED